MDAPRIQDQDVEAPRRFPCAQCGAELLFAPGAQAQSCTHCGHENPIERSAVAVQEQDFRQMLAELQSAADTDEIQVIKCDACAADVELPAHTTALACPFCGSALVHTARSARRIKPAALLPFKFPQEQARSNFVHWLQSRWFAPGAIRHTAAHAERLLGMYVPHWTYDCNTTTAYTGQRGDHYMVTVGSGKNRRIVQHTRWHFASGVVHEQFNDLLVMASHSLPAGEAQALEPWDLHALVPYGDEYLSGFGCESYQVELAEGFDLARSTMASVIEEAVRRDIGGDTQRIEQVTTTYADISYKHILLPVWISAYRFKGRVYRFLVNARTGEVQGQRPWSWIKIVLAFAGIAGVASVAGWLLARG